MSYFKRPPQLTMKMTFFPSWLLVATLLLSGLGPVNCLGQGQGEEEKEPPPSAERAFAIGELEALSQAELQKMFDVRIEELRGVIKLLLRLGARYSHATKQESHLHEKEWWEQAEEGKQVFQQLKEISLVLYLKTPRPDPTQTMIARVMNEKSFEEGRIGIAYEVAQKMARLHPDQEEVQTDVGKLAAYMGDYDKAKEYLATHQSQMAGLPMFEQSLFSRLDEDAEAWELETELRKKEAQQNDLPLVEILTSKGPIVVELFENEAPHSVGNFVSLVKAGFYDDLIFHRVYRNYRVEGGLFSLEEMRTTGYQVVDESTAENARKVFRGSLVLFNSERTKGASEFAIYTAAEPFVVDVKDTVIGRVVEGMEVVESLNITGILDENTGDRTFIKESKPDQILSTKLLRSRPDTRYEPKVLEK